jgi:hypothetical protein
MAYLELNKGIIIYNKLKKEQWRYRELAIKL